MNVYFCSIRAGERYIQETGLVGTLRSDWAANERPNPVVGQGHPFLAVFGIPLPGFCNTTQWTDDLAALIERADFLPLGSQAESRLAIALRLRFAPIDKIPW